MAGVDGGFMGLGLLTESLAICLLQRARLSLALIR